jgi:catechol 2,3-dioxygenase-like lactoylglutathione lyase family enzyme
MPVAMLEHYTIRCADLERTRDFYERIPGLRAGARPAFPFKGYWLYLNDVPIVHLVDAAESIARDGARTSRDTGTLDHIAFRGIDPDAMRATLASKDLAFREAAVPGGRLRQIFVHDPDGIMIELNFRE